MIPSEASHSLYRRMNWRCSSRFCVMKPSMYCILQRVMMLCSLHVCSFLPSIPYTFSSQTSNLTLVNRPHNCWDTPWAVPEINRGRTYECLLEVNPPLKQKPNPFMEVMSDNRTVSQIRQSLWYWGIVAMPMRHWWWTLVIRVHEVW